RDSLPTSGEDPKRGESARLPRPTRAGTQWPVGNGSTRAENGPRTTSEAPLCGISQQPARRELSDRPRADGRERSRYPFDVRPIIGLLSRCPPMLPRNGALPKANTPPSVDDSQ